MIRPYYEEDGITIYHGDCLEVDAWLAADVMITDPPYGRDWTQGDLHGDKHTGIAGDKSTDVRDAAFALWGAKPIAAFGDLMLPPPGGTKQVLVYHKQADAGARGAMAGFRRDAEAVYLIGKWTSGIGGRTSVLKTGARMVGGSIGTATQGGHPHTKPLDVMSLLIGRSTGTVADPFIGSGSTLVAAKQCGRRAIGVELEERYCEIAAKRLAQGMFDLQSA